ncbi:hypothetical protein FV222_00150 [Methylobacterium sp. WL103]|uniref:hypothetical protein n=1 Tax=Methylobacterium sp. WL103 TaxID=2603891 RepID=UPI0011C8F873|nr:hypothetical protein [Methylobacterium sp. WL103]TXN08917.1 hypothetical protein FV222_00150 [Methylobacterium sp. WL103]
MGRRIETFSDLVQPFQEEFNAFMLGELLGSGESRVVYSCPCEPDKWVYKIERDQLHEFHNVREWTTWQQLEDYPDARAWLAPCDSISKGGKILRMARTEPLNGIDDLKGIKIPNFLGDCHWGNLGRFEGRIVCHDYAYSRIPERAVKRFRLVKNDRETG